MSDPFGGAGQRRRPSAYRIASIAIAVVALGIVGVVALTKGGGKHSTHRAPRPLARSTGGPQPRETLAQFEQRLGAAIASPNCQGYRALNRYFPPSCAEVKRRFDGVRFLDSERYGTGAVIDATAPIQPAGITFVLALGPDRRWRILNVYGTKQRTAEKRAQDQIPFDTAADAWLQAVRTRNCDSYVRYAEISVEGSVPRQQICDLDFADQAVVPGALRGDGSVAPQLLGGNDHFQFYALRFSRGHYGTIVATYFPGRGPGSDDAQVAGPLYVS
jgi:hypothetical protein